jgi:hypothetical protein
MQLGRAYETLKDNNTRRAYDLIYPSLQRSRPDTQSTQVPRSAPAPEPLSEAAQIAALQNSIRERTARWQTKRLAFELTILEKQKFVQQLNKEIGRLNSTIAADAAAEAFKKSWGAWLMSHISKPKEESEEQKAQKDRARQERRIEKDMKERRLESASAALTAEEALFKKAKSEADAAIAVDDGKLRILESAKLARESREREEKERAEEEMRARIRKQQQEELRKQQTAARAAEEIRQAAARAAQQKQAAARAAQQKQAAQQQRAERERTRNTTEFPTRSASASDCTHGGWWDKVQGRAACPVCSDVWTYLLQCPTCRKMACPKCQSQIRPRFPRSAQYFRQQNRARSPSPDRRYFDMDWD